jgi:hypothetical protein
LLLEQLFAALQECEEERQKVKKHEATILMLTQELDSLRAAATQAQADNSFLISELRVSKSASSPNSPALNSSFEPGRLAALLATPRTADRPLRRQVLALISQST